MIEYISQLEGEVAAKASEVNDLKMENRALAEENARFRALAEKLLRHQAFHPFLDELSRDPALAESLSKMAQGPSTQSQAPDTKDVDPYSTHTQSFVPQDNQHVGMALVPEPQVDFSSLNIGGNGSWVMQQAHGLPMFQPQVFAVLEVPEPEPLDLTAIAGKGEPVLASFDEEKADYPELEVPSTIKDDVPSIPESKAAVEPTDEEKEWDFPEDDESVALYANTRSTPKPASSESPIPFAIATAALTEKPHFELIVMSEEHNTRLQERLEKMIAKLDVTCNRIAVLTARFNL